MMLKWTAVSASAAAPIALAASTRQLYEDLPATSELAIVSAQSAAWGKFAASFGR